MGFDETHKQRQQRQPTQPAPLSRTTENRAGPRPPEALQLGQGTIMDHKRLKTSAGATPALVTGSSSSSSSSNNKNSGGEGGGGGGGATKRRLRPMELKQQQRLQREQRKRAKLSLTSSLSSSAATAEARTALPPPHELDAFSSPAATAHPSEHETENGGNDSQAVAAAAAPVAFRDSRAAATKAATGGQGGGGKEPLRRSSSSPPSIGSARGSMSYDDPHSFSRRNATPPQGHPVDFISEIVEESRHPAVSSPAKSVEGQAALVEGLPSVRTSFEGRENYDAVVAHDSRSSSRSGSGGSGGAEVRAAAGEDRGVGGQPLGDGGSDDGGGDGRDSTGNGEVAAVLLRQQIESEKVSSGASRGGSGRGGTGVRGSGGGASLFDMVMSGASCSSQSSSGGGGGGGGRGGIGGRNKLSIAATAGARAEGGKPTTSTLSGILGGMRGGQAAQTETSKCFDSIGMAGGGGGGGGGSNEDWMAINLEKLSNFRVPETRMGFPDGAREGLRRSATAPSRSSAASREQPRARGRTGREAEGPGAAAAAGAERAGEPRWRFACRHPFGGTPTAAASAAGSRNTAPQTAAVAATAAPEAKPDLPLRTRVRFEMAPGLAVPRGIGSLPGPLEFRALRAFAAGTGAPETGQRRQPQRSGERNERLGRRRPPRRRPRQEQQPQQQVLGLGPAEAGGGSSGAAQTEPAAAANESRRRQEGDEAMVMWRKATLYWQHPATALPQEALAAQKAAQARIAKNPSHAIKAQDTGSRPGGSAASGWTSFFWSRRRDWEQAFGSLYYGLMSRKDRGGGGGGSGGGSGGAGADGGGTHVGGGEGEGFYLQCPLYTVLWRLVREGGGAGDGETGGGRLVPAAAMTRSTRRIRKRLAAAGINFNMPLDPAGDQRDAQADEDVLEEWKAMGVTGNAKPGAVYTNEEDRSRPHLSLLTFRGHMAVHGLFDFLLEACGHPTGGGGVSGGAGRGRGTGGGGSVGRDFPLLLSREPFLNASLKALKVRQKGPMHRSRGTAGKAGQDSAVEVLELVGHVLPSALADLAIAMGSACAVGIDDDTQDDSRGNTDEDIDSDTEDEEEEDDDDKGGGGGGRRPDGGLGRVAAEAASAALDGSKDNGEGGDDDNTREDVGDGSGTSPRAAGAAAAAAFVPGPGAAGPEENQEQEEQEQEEEAHEDENKLLLFRMMGTVDPDTTYLNAGFMSLEVGGDPALPERQQEVEWEEQQEQQEDEGLVHGVVADSKREAVGRQRHRGGSAAGTPSYVKETRARLLTSSLQPPPLAAARGEDRRGRRRRERRQRSVVFDVCSIDPGGAMTDYVS